MKILMVGTGYVGLVSGLCFAEFGFDTTCVDKNISRLEKIKTGKSPFYEPGINDLLNKHLNSTKLLKLSSNLVEESKIADVIFITVGTPSRRLVDDADLSAVFEVAKDIANNIKDYSVIVTKSTVPVGTTRKIKKEIEKYISKDKFDVVANPEFLREGSAINDFLRPDRVVIGTETKKSEQIMQEIYRPLYLLETPIVSTSIETAEIIKYASNSFLATKISFINEIADLCEVVGADVQDVAKAMGLDKRIGLKYLNAGPGFGGSCFPKDVKAFSTTGKKMGVDLSIINTVNKSNELRPEKITNKIINLFDNKLDNITFCILGLSFKPNTDDVRESTSIKIAKKLISQGAKIQVFDPQAMINAKEILPELICCKTAYDACNNAHALIIATEWNDFRALNLHTVKDKMAKPIIFDLRNIYNKKEITNLDIEYYGIGK